MEEIKYYCYICDEELTDTNNSDEHIILNAIGGHLHSNKLLCKRCNNTLGDTADAKIGRRFILLYRYVESEKSTQESA